MLERRIKAVHGHIHVIERPGEADHTVVFVHGLTSAASAWTAALEALPEGVRGIAFDALGGGYTDRHGPRRPIHDREQAELLLEVAGVPRFACVGHSWGARACVDAALTAPDRVDGLLLACPAIFRRREQRILHTLARRPRGRALLEALAPALVPRIARREVARLGDEPDRLARQAGHALARPREVARGWNDTVGHLDVTAERPEAARYPSITAPLWVLRGAGDAEWAPPPGEPYGELLPAERLELWRDAGHNAPFEHPARFAELLREWCGRVLG